MEYSNKVVKISTALLLAMAPLIVIVPRNSHARTWYIKVDGSGDAATIQAGTDSAAIGDTVLVGPGTYYGEWPDMKEGVSLISEEGPYLTKIVGGGISCSGFIGNFHSEVNGFWMEGNTGMFGAIDLGACYNIDIKNNIFTGNRAGIYIYEQGFPYIENNTFYGNLDCGIDAHFGGHGWVNNNIIWDETPVIGCDYLYSFCNDYLIIACFCPGDGGFSLDPQFCGTIGSGNVYLQSDSPCAPGNDPLGGSCGLIGALPVGCGTVDVKKMTWGEIKAKYEK